MPKRKNTETTETTDTTETPKAPPLTPFEKLDKALAAAEDGMGKAMGVLTKKGKNAIAPEEKEAVEERLNKTQKYLDTCKNLLDLK